MINQARLLTATAEHALTPLGHFSLTPKDGLGDGTLVLIGPDEPTFWPLFCTTPEHGDGDPNPLDRWSRRIVTGIADTLGGTAYFPFGDPPFLPFYSWALRTGRAWQSPIQLLVHDTAGLFLSFRGAIVVPEMWSPAASSMRPCDTCRSQPCACACPVSAFANGYDVAACKAHVTSAAGTDCRTNG